MSVQVDVVAYNALIHAAASSADAGLALSLLDAMAAAGLIATGMEMAMAPVMAMATWRLRRQRRRRCL